MALPTTGQISFEQIRAEFGGSGESALNQYYRGGTRVPNNTTIARNSRGLLVPDSGTISFEDFLGTGDVGNNTQDYTTPNPNPTRYIWTVPSNVYKIEVIAIGGGGGGAGVSYFVNTISLRGNGAGGGGGQYVKRVYNVTPGGRVEIFVGAGGIRGTSNNRFQNPQAIAGGRGGDTEVSVIGVGSLFATGGGGGSCNWATVGTGNPTASYGVGGDYNFGNPPPDERVNGNNARAPGPNDSGYSYGAAAGSTAFGANIGRGGNGHSNLSLTSAGFAGFVRIRY